MHYSTSPLGTVIGALLVSFLGIGAPCLAQDDPTPLPTGAPIGGTLEYESVVLPAGQVARFGRSLVIKAHGDIVLLGSLRPIGPRAGAGGGGPSITLIAGGKVVIGTQIVV